MNDIIFNEPLKYKQICELMDDEEKKGGNNRKKQLDKWKKTYEIEKNGMYYYIKREYTDEEKFFITNNDKFTANIELILLNQIMNSGKTQVTLTHREILENLCMVNPNYYKAKYKEFNSYLMDILNEYKRELAYWGNQDDKHKKEKEVENNMRTYFWKTNNLFKQIINNSLESMQKRDLIIYSRSFKLTKVYEDYIETRVTTPEEDSKILGIIDKVKKEMGDKPLFFMTFKEKGHYYDRIDELVLKEFGYDHCHDATRIIVAENAIKRDLEKIGIIKNAKKLLNQKTTNKMIESKELKKLMPIPQIEIFSHKFIEF